MKKVSLLFCLVITFTLVFNSCKSSTEPDDNNGIPGSGISSSSFAFNVGNEWNYSGKGYNTFNNLISKSVGTARLKVLSQTNSNGLNGFKLYYDSKDFQGNNMGYTEFFISTENNGLWTLEKLPNGSTSPLKLLPFNTNSSVIRSEIINDQYAIYDTAAPWGIHHYENIQLSIDIKFQYIGTENISTIGGNFNNCRKIKVTLDASQKSDTNGVTIFNGKTWNAETTWWLSDNNGLIKTETIFNTVIDSIVSGIYWDPNTGTYKYVYKDILAMNFSASDLRWLDANDLMLPLSYFENWIKIRSNNSLKYLGKYVTEITSKNF